MSAHATGVSRTQACMLALLPHLPARASAEPGCTVYDTSNEPSWLSETAQFRPVDCPAAEPPAATATKSRPMYSMYDTTPRKCGPAADDNARKLIGSRVSETIHIGIWNRLIPTILAWHTADQQWSRHQVDHSGRAALAVPRRGRTRSAGACAQAGHTPSTFRNQAAKH